MHQRSGRNGNKYKQFTLHKKEVNVDKTTDPVQFFV
jgi:hypothetical protein